MPISFISDILCDQLGVACNCALNDPAACNNVGSNVVCHEDTNKCKCEEGFGDVEGTCTDITSRLNNVYIQYVFYFVLAC